DLWFATVLTSRRLSGVNTKPSSKHLILGVVRRGRGPFANCALFAWPTYGQLRRPSACFTRTYRTRFEYKLLSIKLHQSDIDPRGQNVFPLAHQVGNEVCLITRVDTCLSVLVVESF